MGARPSVRHNAPARAAILRRIRWSTALLLLAASLLSVAVAVFVAESGPNGVAALLAIATISAILWLSRQIADGVENVFRRQDRLLRAAVHELYAPLGWLKAAIEEGITGTLSEAEALSEAEDAAADLHQLIADLVEAAQIISGAENLPAASIGLTAIAEEIAAQGTGTDAEIEVMVEAEPPVIEGSAPLLRRAVSNLVRNAVRHGYGGGAGTVTISIHEAGLTVLDRGVGVDPDQLARLRRDVPLGISIEPGGARLGLALVGWVVAVHGGAVTLESNDPEGFRATLEFPQQTEPVA